MTIWGKQFSLNSYRPDPAFVSLARDLQKQDRYVDQYDGPSSLITLSPTAEAKSSNKPMQGSSNLYEEERKTFYSSFGGNKFFDLKSNIEGKNIHQEDISTALNESVKSPKQRFEEFDTLRKSLQEREKFKSQKRFLNQRDRLLKNNWKHGILGIENPDSPTSEVYKEINSFRKSQQEFKDKRAKARQSVLMQ